MRGKAGSLHALTVRARITPAHAGKSLLQDNISFRQRDHPRTCGEKYSNFACKGCYKGSPPHMRGKGRPCLKLYLSTRITPAHAGKRTHMRGKDLGKYDFSDSVRITPAHAGKSAHLWCYSCRWQDHPRTCGEKVQSFCLSEKILGSPPHMRGKDKLV